MKQLTILLMGFCLTMVKAVTIDVLVVYDNKSMDYLQANNLSPAVFAADVVNKINIPIRNSGLNANFRLAHQTNIDYDNVAGTDGTNMRADLQYIKQDATVRNLRAQYNADLVQLIINLNRPQYGSWVSGIGSTLCYYSDGRISESCSKKSAFSVASIQDVANSNIAGTSIHEIGHNLGAGHAREQGDGAQKPFEPYGYGYYFTGNNERKYNTIMAYSQNSYDAPIFSTPCETYQGVAVGKADYADNVRVLNETIGMVASYLGARQTHTPPVNNCDKVAGSIFRDGFE